MTIRHTYANSPASEAGMVPGDRIVQAGNTKIATPEQLRETLSALFERSDNTKLALNDPAGGQTN